MKSLDRDCQQNKSFDGITDEEIIQRLRDNTDGKSEFYIDYLMEKYKPLVRKKSNAMFLIGGETEDLIQEGMIGLFKAIRDFKPNHDSSFFHFADLCISRQMYSAIESSNRKKHQPLNTYVSLQADNQEDGLALEELLSDVSEASPEQMIIQREMQESFFEHLYKELSNMETEVLDLYLDGMNYVQIAEHLGKEPKSIDNALQRIRQKTKIIVKRD